MTHLIFHLRSRLFSKCSKYIQCLYIQSLRKVLFQKFFADMSHLKTIGEMSKSIVIKLKHKQHELWAEEIMLQDTVFKNQKFIVNLKISTVFLMYIFIYTLQKYLFK